MNHAILHQEVQDFIDANLNTDLHKLLFKGSPFKLVSTPELAGQIDAKKRAKTKLPTWFNTPNIYFPDKLNIAQSSSEKAASYKADLIKGGSIVDLTGGFGADSHAFAKHFNNVTHCEHDGNLAQIVKHNLKPLKQTNIEIIEQDGIEYLNQSPAKFDWIYLDPSRRDDHKQRVFLLQDCEPNIIKHLNALLTKSDHILVKLSPVLDISQTIKDLQHVKAIHIVAIDNEVKELLFILEKKEIKPIDIIAVNIKKLDTIIFKSEFGALTNATFNEPLKYLYEPNAAILKAGLFNEVSDQLNIYKLHNNSHLYTSRELIVFPGRRFIIEQKTNYDIKRLKKLIPYLKANITTRNFPQTVAQIRKKTKLKEGGDHYLFFTTDLNDKHIVLVCKKV